jgi:hypothetical protein
VTHLIPLTTGTLPLNRTRSVRRASGFVLVADAWKCLSEFAVPIRAGRIELRERTALFEIQDRETWRVAARGGDRRSR